MTTEFERDMSISVHELDVEAVRQPGIYLKYSQKYAEAVHHRDHCKDAAEVIKAELENNMRNDPKKYNLEKTTDAAVSAAARIHPDVKAANTEFINSNKPVNEYNGAKFAADHKKVMLQLLGNLYVAGYWAEPRVLEKATEGIASEHAKQIMEEELENNPRMLKRRKKHE